MLIVRALVPHIASHASIIDTLFAVTADLCQDVNTLIRRAACANLAVFLSEARDPASDGQSGRFTEMQERVVYELEELSKDEEILVRLSAFQTTVACVGVVSEEFKSSKLAPILIR
jgi:hypothetical protein